MQITHFSNQKINMSTHDGAQYHYCHILDHIAGTLFTGRADYIEKYLLLFSNKVFNALKSGFVPTDEPLIPLIIMDEPDLFSLYYGDYRHLLWNFQHPIRGKDKVYKLFVEAKGEDDYPQLFRIGSNLLSINDHEPLTPEEMEFFLSNYFVACYYNDKPRCKGIAEQYKDLVNGNDSIASIYLPKKHRIDENFKAVGVTIDYKPNYGKNKIPKNNDELSNLMRDNFDVFDELQKISGRITGCGSYLFDGQTSLDYYPAQYPKQKLLFDYCKDKNNILEIGVYSGHSCWLMILANLNNPNFHYTGIDICYFDFTEPCMEYLKKCYPDKITFINSDSMKAIQKLDLDSYDLIHIDGDHGDIVVDETEYILNRISKNKTIIFDDYDSPGPSQALSKFKDNFKILAVPDCPWRNCVTNNI
jgi:hypothetical protein